MGRIYRYVGVVHVHTTFSDGGGMIEEVIAAARNTSLDFLVITDHNDLRAKEYEGWHRDTLVLAGEEVTRPGGNHMLALGINELISPDLTPQEGIEAAKAQGGCVFLAHPFYRGSALIDDPPLLWRDWEVEGFDGIEVWNLTADLYQILGERPPERPPRDVLALATPNQAALCKWDELLVRGHVVGLGGLDAHAERIPRWNGITILPYEKAFRALRIHLLMREPLDGHPRRGRDLILGAICSGNFLVVFDHLYGGEDVLVYVVQGEELFLPGEPIPPGKTSVLQVDLPVTAGIRLIHRAREVLRREGRNVSVRLDLPGPYRLEIYLKNKPWVLVNPFYIGDYGSAGVTNV